MSPPLPRPSCAPPARGAILGAMSSATTIAAEAVSRAAAKFRDHVLSYLPFRAFTLAKIPLAAFAGLRVRALDARACEASVPYGWRSRNPFGSLYFAAHAMAAEMSTGALVLYHLADQGGEASVSTLITKMTATYGKAAKALTVYRCEEGEAVAGAVRRALETGEPVEVDVATRGTTDGVVTADFRFTWSMKRRSKK